MTQILTLGFWFTMRGEMMGATRLILIALIVLLAAGFIYLKFGEKNWRKTFMRTVNTRLANFAIINLAFGLYLWFVMEQVVPYLSARVWLLVWAIEMGWWLYSISKDYKIVPQLRAESEQRKELNRFQPKKNK